MMDYISKMNLKGRKAVIAGGAGLIGKEIVTAIAQAGAETVIADINETASDTLIIELIKNALNVKFHNFDTTAIENVQERINDIFDTYKGIDIWINTAYPRTKDFSCKVEDISVDSWRKNVDMHLNSYSLISKFVAEQMKEKGGNIINIASIYGVVGNDPGLYKDTKLTSSMAYSAIKGGIVNLARYLAAYFGEYGIRINTVCPGGVFDNQDPLFVKRYLERVPLKRMTLPEDVASTCLFLATQGASYITGATIMVDGGWTSI